MVPGKGRSPIFLPIGLLCTAFPIAPAAAIHQSLAPVDPLPVAFTGQPNKTISAPGVASPSRSPLTIASRPASVSQLVAAIDSFGFDAITTMGIGGSLFQDVRPVVLFRDGRALRDVRGLSYPGGLNAHRQTNPDAWTRWRRNGNRIELQTSSGWRALAFRVTYRTLPNQFRLNGTYRVLSGTGTLGLPGIRSSSAVAWQEYKFFPDGRVVRDGGAMARADNPDVSSVTTSVAPTQSGRYQIDGLVLRMRYDDGSTENRIIITNPNESRSAIWLDGVGYSQDRSQ